MKYRSSRHSDHLILLEKSLRGHLIDDQYIHLSATKDARTAGTVSCTNGIRNHSRYLE